MKVKYTEGPESQAIPAARLRAARGETVEVPDEIGERLVEQGWKKVSGGKTTKRKTTKRKTTAKPPSPSAAAPPPVVGEKPVNEPEEAR